MGKYECWGLHFIPILASITTSRHAEFIGGVTMRGVAGISFLIGSVLCLAGCAHMFNPDNLIRIHAYDGAPRDLTEVATIYGYYAVGGESVYISHVDGKYYYTIGGLISSYPSVVHVTPGKHKIKLRYSWANTYAQSDVMEIELEAGHSYAAFATRNGGVVEFGINDKGEGYIPTNKDIMPLYESRLGRNLAGNAEVLSPGAIFVAD